MLEQTQTIVGRRSAKTYVAKQSCSTLQQDQMVTHADLYFLRICSWQSGARIITRDHSSSSGRRHRMEANTESCLAAMAAALHWTYVRACIVLGSCATHGQDPSYRMEQTLWLGQPFHTSSSLWSAPTNTRPRRTKLQQQYDWEYSVESHDHDNGTANGCSMSVGATKKLSLIQKLWNPATKSSSCKLQGTSADHC